MAKVANSPPVDTTPWGGEAVGTGNLNLREWLEANPPHVEFAFYGHDDDKDCFGNVLPPVGTIYVGLELAQPGEEPVTWQISLECMAKNLVDWSDDPKHLERMRTLAARFRELANELDDAVLEGQNEQVRSGL